MCNFFAYRFNLYLIHSHVIEILEFPNFIWYVMNIDFYSFTSPSILFLLTFLLCVFSLFFSISFSFFLFVFLFFFFYALLFIMFYLLFFSFTSSSSSCVNVDTKFPDSIISTSFQIENDNSTLIIHVYDTLRNLIFRNSCLPFFCYQ